jgi:ribosomal protein S18 acetylase RimI-like enzyme/AcrR family transcriptional regulator
MESAMSKQRPGSNQLIQNERRRLLIDATITAISTYGLSNITLAKIAKLAGLTAGSVNFHFDNKETLLLDTLTYLVEELDQSIDGVMTTAGNDPAAQLTAMFEASLDPEITEPKKMAVWYAFSSEARAQQDYRRICGDLDKKSYALTLKLCADIIHRGGNQGEMSPRAMANSVQGLIEEIWGQIFSAGDSYDRQDARYIYQSFLASVFPWSFSMPAEPGSGKKPLLTSDKSLRIVRGGTDDIAELSKLFDLYRQFYKEPADAKLARKFIGDNIRKQRSVVFIARDRDGTALGFTQLYPSLCSVEARPFITLYDLYVSADARQRGVGRALMEAARKYAVKTRASRIDLETAVDNFEGQALYENLGYERDQVFYKYSLELG